MKNLLALLLIFCTVGLSAQLNPKSLYINVKADESVVVEVNSTGAFAPSVVVFPETYDSLGFDPLGGGVWEFTFVPSSGFTGDTKLVIEYYQPSGIPGFNIPNYSTFYYRVKESKIDCVEDRVLVESGVTTEIDVLLNDSSTDGNLSLEKIGYVEGGTASIVSNKISFTPDGSSQDAYVRYFSSDTTDNMESSVLYVQIEDDQLQDQRQIFVDNLSEIDIPLNGGSFTNTYGPNNGNVVQNGHVWNYESNPGFVGTDSISFTSPGGGQIEYSIEVLNKIDDRSFVQDDQYFVVTNGSLSFNVFDNDYRDEFNIIDYSSELSYLGNGEFQFTPETDFTGDLLFYYKIFAGFQFHTGEIIIHVDDYAPNQDYDYHFTILNNHDLVVEHQAPVEDYYFQLITEPENGSLIILDVNETEVLDCETIEGDNTIIYIPDTDFDETDEFAIEFCTTTGICETINVHVDVLSSNYTDCLCLIDCVYKGDNNNDGAVSTKDVLDLALNLGEAGTDRQNDFDLFWTGQESVDWGHEQLHSTTDLKNADSDGNGFLEYDDFLELEESFGLVHSFVPNEVGDLSTVPISFIPQSTEVDSGEWMFIDIYAGSSSQAALDFYGLAFSFNMDPELIDSSSVNLLVNDDNWLSKGSPLYQFFEVPLDGRVDVAISRVNNVSTDGIGIIATLEFIVEDEFEGLKELFGSYVDRELVMSNIISVDEHGSYRLHPEQIKTIKVATENGTEQDFDIASQLNIYPNPSSSLINFHSDKYSIDKIELYDIMGRRIDTHKLYKEYRKSIDLSSLQEGVYLARVHINGQVVTRKIQKFDQ